MMFIGGMMVGVTVCVVLLYVWERLGEYDDRHRGGGR